MKISLFPKFLTFLLLSSFIGLAVFGFTTMSHAEDHNPNGCIAAASRETDCSQANSPLAMFNLHIDALKIFSNLTFNNYPLRALLLVFIFLIFFSGFEIFSVLPLNYTFLASRRALIFNSLQKIKVRQFAWFSLHENSPTPF